MVGIEDGLDEFPCFGEWATQSRCAESESDGDGWAQSTTSGVALDSCGWIVFVVSCRLDQEWNMPTHIGTVVL